MANQTSDGVRLSLNLEGDLSPSASDSSRMGLRNQRVAFYSIFSGWPAAEWRYPIGIDDVPYSVSINERNGDHVGLHLTEAEAASIELLPGETDVHVSWMNSPDNPEPVYRKIPAKYVFDHARQKEHGFTLIGDFVGFSGLDPRWEV